MPVLTYFPAFNIAQQFWPITEHAPQQLTNGLMLWVVVNTLIATAAIGVLGRGSATLASVGIWPRGFHVGRMLGAAAAAVVLVGVGYAHAARDRHRVFGRLPLLGRRVQEARAVARSARTSCT